MKQSQQGNPSGFCKESKFQMFCVKKKTHNYKNTPVSLPCVVFKSVCVGGVLHLCLLWKAHRNTGTPKCLSWIVFHAVCSGCLFKPSQSFATVSYNLTVDRTQISVLSCSVHQTRTQIFDQQHNSQSLCEARFSFSFCFFLFYDNQVSPLWLKVGIQSGIIDWGG